MADYKVKILSIEDPVLSICSVKRVADEREALRGVIARIYGHAAIFRMSQKHSDGSYENGFFGHAVRERRDGTVKVLSQLLRVSVTKQEE